MDLGILRVFRVETTFSRKSQSRVSTDLLFSNLSGNIRIGLGVEPNFIDGIHVLHSIVKFGNLECNNLLLLFQ